MFTVRTERDHDPTMKKKAPRPAVTSASPQRDLVALSLLLRG
jgi:heme O synthase-like polyprenyltransferase